jgi:hypothetical protein
LQIFNELWFADLQTFLIILQEQQQEQQQSSPITQKELQLKM